MVNEAVRVLGISKQRLVADAMEEWFCRNHTLALPRDPSPTVQRALDEFMRRHRDKFLSFADSPRKSGPVSAGLMRTEPITS